MLLCLRSLYFFVSFSPKIQPTLKQSWRRTFELRRWGAWQQQCLDTDKWLWRLSYIDNALRKLRIKVMVVSTYISVNLSSKKLVFYACRPYSDLFRIRDWFVAGTDSNLPSSSSPSNNSSNNSSPLTKFSYTVKCLYSIGKSLHANW